MDYTKEHSDTRMPLLFPEGTGYAAITTQATQARQAARSAPCHHRADASAAWAC